MAGKGISIKRLNKIVISKFHHTLVCIHIHIHFVPKVPLGRFSSFSIIAAFHFPFGSDVWMSLL